MLFPVTLIVDLKCTVIPAFPSCHNLTGLCLQGGPGKGISFLKLLFHSLQRVNQGATLKTEAEGHWRQQQRFLEPAIKSLSPYSSHPGDCKHWLSAMVFYRTSLSYQPIWLQVLIEVATQLVLGVQRMFLFYRHRRGKCIVAMLEF